MKVKIGTRGSKCALADKFCGSRPEKAAPEIDIEVCVIKTRATSCRTFRSSRSAGQGVFVKEIEEALLSGSIDLAVHSMKDVPARFPGS